MIQDYEFYHGVVLRQIICQNLGVLITQFDFAGRVDSFRLGSDCAIHIKHSTSRMSPWIFTVSTDNLKEIIELQKRVRYVFFVLVCGFDGIVTLPIAEFVQVSEARPGGAVPIRVSRGRKEMYSVSGNLGTLGAKKATGLGELFAALHAGEN